MLINVNADFFFFNITIQKNTIKAGNQNLALRPVAQRPALESEAFRAKQTTFGPVYVNMLAQTQATSWV